MSDEVRDAETAITNVKEYAEKECLGEFGTVGETREQDNDWIIEFRTHTLSNAYKHRVRIAKSTGNVISHNCTDCCD